MTYGAKIYAFLNRFLQPIDYNVKSRGFLFGKRVTLLCVSCELARFARKRFDVSTVIFSAHLIKTATSLIRVITLRKVIPFRNTR